LDRAFYGDDDGATEAVDEDAALDADGEWEWVGRGPGDTRPGAARATPATTSIAVPAKAAGPATAHAATAWLVRDAFASLRGLHGGRCG
jgi:hypothetical protein